MKKIFELSFGYGKYDNMKVEETFILEDTKTNRQSILDEYSGWQPDFKDDLENFLNGNANSISLYRDAVDWDETNCMIIEVKSYEDKLLELVEDFKNSIQNLQNRFAIA